MATINHYILNITIDRHLDSIDSLDYNNKYDKLINIINKFIIEGKNEAKNHFKQFGINNEYIVIDFLTNLDRHTRKDSSLSYRITFPITNKDHNNIADFKNSLDIIKLLNYINDYLTFYIKIVDIDVDLQKVEII